MFSLFTKKQLSIVDKAMLKKALFRACKICVSFVFWFNIKSRKIRKLLLFHVFFKREFCLFLFSLRGRKMNKQLEYSISARGQELNAHFWWLVSWRSNRAIISSSAVSRSRIIVLSCGRCTDSWCIYCNFSWLHHVCGPSTKVVTWSFWILIVLLMMA